LIIKSGDVVAGFFVLCQCFKNFVTLALSNFATSNMPDESLKRFDRIVAILIQLQSKKVVRAQELAQRFDVSLRTIYRDIRTLEVSGVPIYGEAGTGYSLVDGYRLPPVMFTRDEAGSFIAAEKLMQQFTDAETGGHYASAMFKLKSVLKNAEKELVSNMESKVLIRNTNPLFDHKVPNALAAIFRSMGEKNQIILFYQAMQAEEASERTIEPVGVFHENNNWYVFGFCHLRKDYRQFRADRIHEIRSTDKAFTRHHGALETYLKPDAALTTTIRISVAKDLAKYMRYDRKGYGFVSEEERDDKVEMTFESRDVENGFSRWFMMYCDVAEILEPEALKIRVLELLEMGKSKIINK